MLNFLVFFLCLSKQVKIFTFRASFKFYVLIVDSKKTRLYQLKMFEICLNYFSTAEFKMVELLHYCKHSTPNDKTSGLLVDSLRKMQAQLANMVGSRHQKLLRKRGGWQPVTSEWQQWTMFHARSCSSHKGTNPATLSCPKKVPHHNLRVISWVFLNFRNILLGFFFLLFLLCCSLSYVVIVAPAKIGEGKSEHGGLKNRY